MTIPLHRNEFNNLSKIFIYTYWIINILLFVVIFYFIYIIIGIGILGGYLTNHYGFDYFSRVLILGVAPLMVLGPANILVLLFILMIRRRWHFFYSICFWFTATTFSYLMIIYENLIM